MVETTRDWKTALGCYNVPNRNPLVPANDLKIIYEQIDAEAQNDAATSVNTRTSFSDDSEVMNLSLVYANEKRIATLEPNEWVLDGNSEIMGYDSHTGWVSNDMSNADGTFTTNPVMTLTWEEAQVKPVPGLRIWFSSILNEWASEFRITAYRNNMAIYTRLFYGTRYVDFYEGGFTNYDEVRIEIIKWCLPYRRARIENVCMGFVVHIGKKEVLSLEHDMNSNILSLELPDDSFTFEIDNVSEEWNPDNPTGIYAYLYERQRVTVKYAFKINGSYEWITAGTYYMSDWTTPQNGITASFTGRSLVEFMTSRFEASLIEDYTYGDSITLKDLAENAFSQADLPVDADGSDKWSIDDSLDDIEIVIPYTESESEGVTTYEWQFDHTCAEVIQLVANAGCCTIRPNTNGDIVIAPTPQTVGDYYIDRFVSFEHGEYELTKALKSIEINNGEYTYTPSASALTGEVQSISNELIQDTEVANANGAWLSDILTKRKTLDGEFRADPRLQPLDVVTIVNKYARNRVFIEGVKWTYEGAFRGYYIGKVIKSIPLIDDIADQYTGYAYCGEYGGGE